MRLRVFPDAGRAGRTLALEIAQALAANPSLVLGLPTGHTPIPLYRALVALHEKGRADFSRAAVFNLDEFLGLRPRDPRSYHAFMHRYFFDGVNLRPSRIHFLNGATRDPAAECARYDASIARAGGIDIQILGLGLNGHVGFNEPARALVAETHRVRLRPATRRANLSLFDGKLRDVPREGLTMGMAAICRARRIVLLSTGAHKAQTVARLLGEGVTTTFPASFLHLHPDAELWVDREAARAIRP